jgi:hypothetical protein
MSGWFKKDAEELAKTLVRLTSHGVVILIALAVEGLVFYALQYPEFASARPYVEPILKGALLLTVLLLCVIFVSLLTLSGWAEVKKRHDQEKGGVGGWIVVGIVLTVTLTAVVFFTEQTPPSPGLRPRVESEAYDVAFDLPRHTRGRRSTTTTLNCPVEAKRLKLRFFVPVQKDYQYFAKLDDGQPERVEFHEDGVLEKIIPHANLLNSAHRLAVYKRAEDEVDLTEVETYRFEMKNEH